MEDLGTDRFTVNIYDVFANFLPGFVVIAGGFLPLLTSDLFPSIGFFEAGVTLFVAFAIGGVVQAMGSKFKHYQFRLPFCSYPSKSKGIRLVPLIETRKLPFNYKMEEIKDSMENSDTNPYEERNLSVVERKVMESRDENEEQTLSLVEKNFFEACKKLYDFEHDEDLEDWGYLFKINIAHLEASPYNRTMRLQAQHLAARGLYISLLIVSFYYLSLSVSYFGIGTYTELFEVNEWIVAVLLFGSIFFILPAYLLYLRSIHFEEDVVKYMMSEIVLSAGLEN